MNEASHPPAELSRWVHARQIDEAPVNVVANDTERAALAERFGLVAVDALEAIVALEPKGGAVLANGSLSARIVQTCAVSGDDLPVSISEPIALRFVPEDRAAPPPQDDPEAEIELSAEDLDDIAYSGDRFDLGEAVAQTLGLAIDPYLEGPGAEAAREAGLVSSEEASGPFAALAALKKD